MARPKGSKNGDVEQRWYDVFAEWSAADREAALRILGLNHRAILVAEAARQPKRPANEDTPKTGELELSTAEELAEAGKLEGGK
jgi:hypothetical protein